MSAIYPLSIHRRIDRQCADRIKSVEARILIGTEEKSQRAPKEDANLLKSVKTIAPQELVTTPSVLTA